jgi:nucleotide-binding universal stress UspA family protein
VRSEGLVLVAYDGSASSRRALEHAAAFTPPGGHVLVANVIPEQSVSARLETVSDAQRAKQRRLLREAESILKQRGIAARPVALAGERATELLAAAQATGARLLIVGSDGGRHVLRRSLSAALARRASCDVLIVH